MKTEDYFNLQNIKSFKVYFIFAFLVVQYSFNTLFAQNIPNPIRYYPLDNGNANEIINNKNGTNHGDIRGVTDRFGNPTGAADFWSGRVGSNNNFIETPNFFEGVDVSNGRYAITFWAFERDTPSLIKAHTFFACSGAVTTRQELFGFGPGNAQPASTTTNKGELIINRYIPDRITGSGNKSFSYWLWSPMDSSYYKGRWTFFAISYTKQGTRVYMRNQEHAKTEWATNYFPSQDLSTATFWGFGDYGSYHGSYNDWKSIDYLDDFKVYADSLDINQFERLFNTEKPHNGNWGIYRMRNKATGMYFSADYGVDNDTDKDIKIKQEDHAGSTVLWKINFPQNTDDYSYIQWLGDYGKQKVVDLNRSYTSDNSEVSTYGENEGNNQHWTFVRNSNGTYRIKSKLGDYYLGTNGGGTSEGTTVVLRSNTQTNNTDLWDVEEVNLKPFDEDFYRFQNKNSGLYFSQGDLTYWDEQVGLDRYKCEFRAEQRTENAGGCGNIWNLKVHAHNDDKWRSYNIKSINVADQYWRTWYGVKVGFTVTGTCIVPRNWSWDDGDLLVTGSGDNDAEAQWIFWKDTKGFIRIANYKHAEFAVTKNASTSLGEYIVQYSTGEDNSRWINFEKVNLHSVEDNTYFIKVNTSINTPYIAASNPSNGWDWVYLGEREKAGRHAIAFNKSPDNTYLIGGLGYSNARYFLDLNNFQIGDNYLIANTYYDDNRRSEKWFIYKDSQDKYRIANAYSMMYMRGVQEGSTSYVKNCCDNDQIDGGWNQWILQNVPKSPFSEDLTIENYKITNVASGKVLDAYDYQPASVVGLWDWHSGDNQIWSIGKLLNEESVTLSDRRSNYVLDIFGNSLSDNAGAIIYPTKLQTLPNSNELDPNAFNQRWKIQFSGLDNNGKDTYYIINKKSNKCLALANNFVSYPNGQQLVQIDMENPNYAKTWYLDSISFSSYYRASNIVNQDLTSISTKKEIEGIFDVRPNPVEETINVYLPSNIVGTVIFSISDYTGRVVFKDTKFVETGESLVKIHVPNLQKGIYILTVSDSDGMSINSKRIILK